MKWAKKGSSHAKERQGGVNNGGSFLDFKKEKLTLSIADSAFGLQRFSTANVYAKKKKKEAENNGES